MNIQHSNKVISKLNRDTKEDLIVWQTYRGKPSSLVNSEVLSENVYLCKVLEKNIRLYKYEYRDYHYDEDTFMWLEDYRLEFIDSWGNSEWTFPKDRAIYDLYDTVRYKTSNVDNFIDNFLSEDEKNEGNEDEFNF